jgi:beta-mannosidase
VPIFAKGSNWIPADSFPTRIEDGTLEHLIRSAAETHQNMLRVWGGGLYEDNRFYDLCDRYGILVWQDFVFSCSVYPQLDEEFLANVRAEVIQNVRRLRHRASLALWCGNNEMEWGWAQWGWDRPEQQDLKEVYDRFFHNILPAWCRDEDPDHAFWPSSPSSGVPFEDPNSEGRGDAHFWGVWHGRLPFTAYRSQYPRFMSEFGFQSLPPLETIATYAEPRDWNLTSYMMEYHQRGNHGNGLMIGQMTETFRMPKDFSSLVYLSLVLQAEGIRYGVEHWRRAMQRVSGTLYWQLNDCWPVVSWSSIDWYGRWKALHYAARRFYAPLLLSVEDEGTWMGVHVTSDLTEAWEGTVRWALETLDGAVLVEGQDQVSAMPLASTEVCTLDFVNRLLAGDRSGEPVWRAPDEPGEGVSPREAVFVCELWGGDLMVSRCVAPFVPSKHLALVDPGLAIDLGQQDDQLIFHVTARSLARFVELALEGVDVVFGDNYFDVPANRTVAVTCPLPEGWSVERARQKLRVRSLYDSYA